MHMLTRTSTNITTQEVHAFNDVHNNRIKIEVNVCKCVRKYINGKDEIGMNMHDTYASKLRRTQKHMQTSMHVRNKHRHYHRNTYTK